MHSSPYRGFRTVFAAILSLALMFLAGCAGDGAPTEPVALLPVDGATVPEVVEEGTSVEIQIWGPTSSGDWGFGRLDVARAAGGTLILRAVGAHVDAAAGSPRATYVGTGRIVAPAAGIWIVSIEGSNGRIERRMLVHPRGAIVNLDVRDEAAQTRECLFIAPDGWAVAMRRGDRPPARVRLDPGEIDRIRSRFVDARFLEMDERYVSDEPSGGLRYSVLFRPVEGRPKHVVAEDLLAPEALRALVGDLRRLLQRILDQGPGAPPVVGVLRVDPAAGEPGAPRTIQLQLRNRSGERVVLRFSSGLQFDFAIVSLGRGDGPGGPMDPGGPGCPGGPGGPDAPDRLVWNWANGRVIDPNPTEIGLPAGGEWSRQVEWNGRGNEGEPVAEGIYQLAAFAVEPVPVEIAPQVLIVGDPPPPLAVIASLSVDPVSAPAGAGRTLHLSVRNESDRPVTLRFRTGHQYDFHINDPRMMRPLPQWTWSTGRLFDPSPSERTIPPRSAIEIEETWGGRFIGDEMPPRGVYIVDAVLLAGDLPPIRPARLEVTR